MLKILLVSAVFALVACKEMPGTLNVRHEFTAITKSSFFRRAQENQIPAGDHAIVLKGSLGSDLTVEIPLNNETHKIHLNIPRKGHPTADGRFPTENGRFFLTPTQLEQPFSAQGEIRTSYQDSATMRDVEYCSYPREKVVCRERNGYEDCDVETEYVPGQQEVAYYTQLRTTTLWLEIIDSKIPSSVAATFGASEESSQRVYTFKGYCQRTWGWY